ncbi:hypothetical protein [Cellulosimicrobium sp. Marseille-Q4280]|uniref:hypothetical protein n=1 Tax=Cellulosimicrobium sp. Marseille-Q4280 TaxID=2937992 RepID=UPI002040B869|nr:hypothetical protein [Cellulosimicrobium sp. Marseille-Q4280]
MSTNYTATVTVADGRTDPDDVLDALVGFSPVWAQRGPGRVDVTLSLDAASLPEATSRVVELVELVELVEAATRSGVARVEIATSEEFDRENGAEPAPV